MTIDLYSPCPCGSGEKLKFCCHAILPAIEHAVELDANGQHDAALRAIDQVAQQHPRNPEVWGQKARLLFVNEKPEQADEALQKAFDINPNYPFGLLLRAQFRLSEGEVQGALLLARRAAEAYDPRARDFLGEVYTLIFQCEDRLHRPVAARAALTQILHYQPTNEEVRAAAAGLFGPDSPLPASARADYNFLSPPAGRAEPGSRRAAWDQALAGAANNPRLAQVATAFAALTAGEGANDAAAWYNLALTRAWLGENAAALEALDRYIDLEPDEAAAGRAAALGEVLRLGAGLEDRADYLQYGVACQLREGGPVNALVQGWIDTRRLMPIQTEQQGLFFGLLLETAAAGLVTAGRPASDHARLAGYLTIAGNVFQITSPVKEPFERLREEARAGLRLGCVLRERVGPGEFREALGEAVIYPTGAVDGEEFKKKALEHAQRHYEDVWIHRPRKSLDGVPPVDAAGSPRLKKKLLGVIQFLQECAVDGALAELDFDRLRRKLGLATGSPALGATAKGAAGAAVPADLSALSAAELSALPLATLTDDQLEQAYQAAHRLAAEELTAHFAETLVGRPTRAERPDRFPYFSFLVQKALRDGQPDRALTWLADAEKQDAEANGGVRRNDYELRRAQVHVRAGRADEAAEAFAGLIDRAATNLDYRSEAAEAMLRLKQPKKAITFAEGGLEAARKQNNRDREQQMLDLVGAAKRQGA